MSAEFFKLDLSKRTTVSGGVTNDASLDPMMLRLDPSSKRLLTDASLPTFVDTLSTDMTGNPGVVAQALFHTTPTVRTNGQRGPLEATVNGHLLTSMGTLISGEDASNGGLSFFRKPLSTATYTWDQSKTTAYAASLVVKAAPGVIRSIHGYSSRGSAQWVQLHNTTSLPADTAVPDVIATVATVANFVIDFGEDGYYCSTGITICNSSTGPTKTIGSADCWFVVKYK
jgi:hypothetical protein